MSTTNSIPGSNANFISLNTAIDMTSRYRSDKESILALSYQNQNILPNSETFNRNAFDVLLALDACAALRIYYGMDANSKVHAIIVPVNSSNQDILPFSNALSISNPGIVEEGQRCPDLCPPSSSLNS